MKQLTILILPTIAFVSSASAAINIFQDNFDPGVSGSWASIVNGTPRGDDGGTTNSEFFDFNALWFDGTSRVASTGPLNLSAGGSISFMLKIGGPNDTTVFEQADAGENVFLEYSTNGSVWSTLVEYSVGDANYSDNWGSAIVNFTDVAPYATAATYIRWNQPTNSGSSFDNWAIDNVSITVVPEPSTYGLLAGLTGLVWCLNRRRR